MKVKIMKRMFRKLRFRKLRCSKEWKASYTVEASLMIPLLIGAMVIAMRMSIGCYESVRQQKEQEKVCAMWEVKEFYRYQALKEIVDD